MAYPYDTGTPTISQDPLTLALRRLFGTDGGAGAPQAPASAPTPAAPAASPQAVSEQPTSHLTAPSEPIGRPGTLLWMMTGGNSYEKRQRAFAGGIQQQAAEKIGNAIQNGTSPTRAIMDFISTPEGQGYFTNGGDMAGLANIAKTVSAQPVQKPVDVQEYEYATAQGYGGSYVDYQKDLRHASASNTNVNVNNAQETALQKALGQKTGELWSTYSDRATNAGNMSHDLEVMQQLVTGTPTGPIPGQLQKWFPGVDDKMTAFNSSISQLVPRFRVPGSGAQSDKDVELILQGLPSVKNNPAANKLIVAALSAKAQIDIQRGDVVDDYASGVLTEAEARKRLGEINRMSIMTPELKAAFSAVSGKSSTTDGGIPDSFEPGDPDRERVWQFMSEKDKALWQ